jgi:hypothetical protein
LNLPVSSPAPTEKFANRAYIAPIDKKIKGIVRNNCILFENLLAIIASNGIATNGERFINRFALYGAAIVMNRQK